MSIKGSFNSAQISNRPYTLTLDFMRDALNFLIYKKAPTCVDALILY